MCYVYYLKAQIYQYVEFQHFLIISNFLEKVKYSKMVSANQTNNLKTLSKNGTILTVINLANEMFL